MFTSILNGFLYALCAIIAVALLVTAAEGWNLWLEYFNRTQGKPLPAATVVRYDIPAEVPAKPVAAPVVARRVPISFEPRLWRS